MSQKQILLLHSFKALLVRQTKGRGYEFELSSFNTILKQFTIKYKDMIHHRSQEDM